MAEVSPGTPVVRQTISVPELASLLGIAPKTAFSACHRGEIRSIKVGKLRLVPLSEVERLLGSRPSRSTASCQEAPR